MPECLSAGLASVGEIQVFDHYGATPAPPCQPQDRCDRRPEPPIAGARWKAIQNQGNGVGCTDRVPERIHNPAGQMPCIQVYANRPASAKLIQCWWLHRLGLPGGIQVPAVSVWLEADVVPHRSIGRLGSPFVPPMVEDHRTRQTVGAGTPGRVG
jgi:hypothetical protein